MKDNTKTVAFTNFGAGNRKNIIFKIFFPNGIKKILIHYLCHLHIYFIDHILYTKLKVKLK